MAEFGESDGDVETAGEIKQQELNSDGEDQAANLACFILHTTRCFSLFSGSREVFGAMELR